MGTLAKSLLLFALNWLDAQLTLLWVHLNVATEGNALMARVLAYGWKVRTIDGHDHEAIAAALSEAREEIERPRLIICRSPNAASPLCSSFILA